MNTGGKAVGFWMFTTAEQRWLLGCLIAFLAALIVGGIRYEVRAQQVARVLQADQEGWPPASHRLASSAHAAPATHAAPSASSEGRGESLPTSTGQVKLNINTATAGELTKLPGIGPALAERIVAYRHEHGPFSTTEDLGRVSGIGPATVKRLTPLVILSTSSEEAKR